MQSVNESIRQSLNLLKNNEEDVDELDSQINNQIKESEKFLEEVDWFQEEAEKLEGEEIINEKYITKSDISKIIKNQKK